MIMRCRVLGWWRTVLLFAAGVLISCPSVARAAERLFVVNQAGSSISVIDVEAMAVTDTISVAAGPAAIAVTAKMGRIFITHPERSEVTVLDAASLTIEKTFEVKGTPFGIAVDVDNRLLISDWNLHCVHVVDAVSGAEIVRIPVGQSPAGIVAGAKFAYVANRESDSVSVIDLPTLQVSATVDVGRAPFAIALGPNETQVYVANVQASTLSVISTNAPAKLRDLETGKLPYGIGLTANGGRIVVANQQSGTASIFAGEGLELQHTVRVGDYPEGVVVAEDGRRAFIANWFSDDVSVVDLDAGREIARIKTGKGPRGLALIPLNP